MADKNKNNYLWIGIAVVVVIVLAIVFMNYNSSKKVLQTDITLSNFKYEEASFKYEEASGSGIPINFNKNNQLEAEFSLKISTIRDDLYYRVYDSKHNLEINKDYESDYSYDYPQKLSVGDNRFEGYRGLVLDGLSDKPQINVCISTNQKFTENSEGVVCKMETFDSPEFKLEITPNPMTFIVSKSEGTWDTPYQTLTIKNTGNIVTPSLVFLPSSYAGLESYTNSNPQYLSRPRTFMTWLQPGESYEYDVGVTIGNVGEFDTPLGTYETKGYVWGLGPKDGDYNKWSAGEYSFEDARFKKEFTLKTIVNP